MVGQVRCDIKANAPSHERPHPGPLLDAKGLLLNNPDCYSAASKGLQVPFSHTKDSDSSVPYGTGGSARKTPSPTTAGASFPGLFI